MRANTFKSHRSFTLFFLCWIATAGFSLHAQNGSRNAVQEAWEVYRILQRSCSECHGGQIQNPKAGFGYVLDLPRLVSEGDYVTPGDPDASELYLCMVDEDPDYRMPPPDSDAVPLSPEEIATIKRWIERGASPGFAISSAPLPTSEADVHAAPTAIRVPAAVRQPGRFHPALVHFPIALLLAALLAEAFAIFHPRRKALHGATRVCLWGAAAGAIAAAATGWLMAGEQGYAAATVFDHRWLGVGTAIVTSLCLFAFEIARHTRQKWSFRLMWILLLLAAALVAAAGHTGGELVYGGDWFW